MTHLYHLLLDFGEFLLHCLASLQRLVADALELLTDAAQGFSKLCTAAACKILQYVVGLAQIGDIFLHGSIQSLDFSNQRICLLFKRLDFFLGQFVALFQLLVDARKFFLVVISLLFESIH